MEENDIHPSGIQEEITTKQASQLFASFFPWAMDDSDGNANECASFEEAIRNEFTDNAPFPCIESEQEISGFFDSFSKEACPMQESVNLQGSFGYPDESKETHHLKEKEYHSKTRLPDAKLVDDQAHQIPGGVRNNSNSTTIKLHGNQLKEQRAQKATQVLAELEDTFTKVTRILQAFSVEELFDEVQFSPETLIDPHQDTISRFFPQQIPGIKNLSQTKQLQTLQKKIKSLQIELAEKETATNQRVAEASQAKQTIQTLQNEIKTIKTQQIIEETSQIKQTRTLRIQIKALQTQLATKEAALNDRSSEASLKEIHLSQLQFLLSTKHRNLSAKEALLQKQAEDFMKQVAEYQTARDLETRQQKREKEVEEEQKKKPLDFFLGRESIFHQRMAQAKRYVAGYWGKPVKMVDWESESESENEGEKRLGREKSGKKRAASSSAGDDSVQAKRMKVGRPRRIPTRKPSLDATPTRSDACVRVVTDKTAPSEIVAENEIQSAHNTATQDEGDSETLRGDDTDKE